jgi:hypothetical protein
LNAVFASAELALERDLEKTTLAGLLEKVKNSCQHAKGR